jgi:hypothetical protein
MPTTHLDDLKRQMEEAVASQDFETAGKLRDQIEGVMRGNLVRGVEEAPQASYFQRQVPGKMGLGSDQQAYVPPPGWIPPKKPDPMTAGYSKGGRRRKG